MKVIIIDQHPIDDDRIIRHIRYLLSSQTTVVRLHINRDDPALNKGFFSLFGETGYRINEKKCKLRLMGSIYFNFIFCLTPLIFFDVKQFLKQEVKGELTPIIIHVHDAVFLNLAIMIREYLYPHAKIVYDRHELYEHKTKKYGINIIRIPRLYEILTGKKIDGVVSVSRYHNPVIRKLFPNVVIATVPNFPLLNGYDQGEISNKISQFNESSEVSLIYIGSLDDDFDRDITFLLKIAEEVLQHFSRAIFTIGGECNNPDLKNKLIKLGARFPDRFCFLGHVPREKTVRITEHAHIGFFLLKPLTSYWVKCSPNKIFEYLVCGVIPVVRADVDYAEDLESASLIFGQNTSESTIIDGIKDLILNPEECKRLMKSANDLGKKLTFSAVGQNYMDLYKELTMGN